MLTVYGIHSLLTCPSLQLIVALAMVAIAAAEHHFGGYNNNFGSGFGGGYGAHIPILRYENVNNGDGTYRYK